MAAASDKLSLHRIDIETHTSTSTTENNEAITKPLKNGASLLCATSTQSLYFHACTSTSAGAKCSLTAHAVEESTGKLLTAFIEFDGYGVEQIACSKDGRMICAAVTETETVLDDVPCKFKLVCWDVHVVLGSSEMKLVERWSIHNNVSASSCCSKLEFDANYQLLQLWTSGDLQIIDAVRGNVDVSANGGTDEDSASSSSKISSAAWCPFNSSSSSSLILLGYSDGSIHLCNSHDLKTTVTSTISIPELIQSENNSGIPQWSCTHLNCFNPSNSNSSFVLTAGYCRITPSEEDDEEDEDDPAMHEVCLFVTNATFTETSTTSSSKIAISQWNDLGDVLPFFSIPRHGRHVFYTNLVPEIGVLIVGCNVSSEIGVIARGDGANFDTWDLIDLPESDTVTTPLTKDDEYTFPNGFAVFVGKENKRTLAIGATDGSVSIVEFHHPEDEEYARVKQVEAIQLTSEPVSMDANATEASVVVEPSTPVVKDANYNNVASLSVKVEDATPKIANLSFGGGDSLKTATSSTKPAMPSLADNETSSIPFRSNNNHSSATAGYSFGSSGGGALMFGSAASGNNDNKQVAATTTPAKTTPIFGSTSSSVPVFGSGTKPPVFGSSPSPGFGFGSSSGFGALAAAGNNSPDKLKQQLFKGKSAKELLTEFYKKHNPEKLVDADKNLLKYSGREEEMFRNLALKYEVDAMETFGVSANPVSVFGAGGVSSPFGSAAGKSSTGFGSFASPSTTTTTTSSGFGFGSFAAGNIASTSSGGFGGIAASSSSTTSGGFGGFGGVAASTAITNSSAFTGFGSGRDPAPKEHDEDELEDVDSSSADDGSTAAEASDQDPEEASEGENEESPKFATITTPEAKLASDVFDSIDTEGTGKLPASKFFEELVEELGEGFYGDELEKQLAIVDADQTGIIERTAFISWYKNLVDGAVNHSDDESIDSEEAAERAEEKVKAEKAFRDLATNSIVASADFGKLIESLGTVYCEEEHRRTLKKIASKGGVITEAKFVEWYIDWLFGDGDSDSDYSDDDDEEEEDAAAKKADDIDEKTMQGWGGCFAVDADSWKCEACMVRNKGDVNKCAACETVRPGHEEKEVESSSSTSAQTAAISSIGAGGFSFGGSTASASGSSIGAGGFSFGGGATSFGAQSTVVTTAATASTGGGFVFGDVATKPADASSEKKVEESKDASKGSVEPSGFQFASSATTSTSSGEKTEESKKAASAGFPPMSSKAPTPFGASKSTQEEKSDTSKASDFNFGGFGKTDISKKESPETGFNFGSLSVGTGASNEANDKEESKPVTSFNFPPKPGIKPKSSSASAGFPPMSKAAPTPFGAKPAEKTTASSGFPPMSKAAPTPFGAKPAEKTSTSAGFPPMSKAAPTPFGLSSKHVEKASAEGSSKSSSFGFGGFGSSSPSGDKVSSSGFNFGNLPFGAGKDETTANDESKSTSSFSFPPKPGTKSKQSTSDVIPLEKPPSTAGFPPISKSAPTPFGAPPKPAEKPSSGSSSFPPMAGKAPTPFGTATAKPSLAAAGFPPMSTKAPTPFGSTTKSVETKKTGVTSTDINKTSAGGFGGFGKADEGKPLSSFSFSSKSDKSDTVAKSTNENASSSTAGFPPMSKAAPTPFGVKPAEKSASSSFGGFPPMSSKSPTPFGTITAAKPAEKSTASASAGFPPMSTKAPTPFGAAPKPAVKQSSSCTAKVPGGSKSGATYIAASEYEAQIWKMVSSLEKSIAFSASLKEQEEEKKRSDEFNTQLDKLLEVIDHTKATSRSIGNMVGTEKQRSIFLLSQKEDFERQVAEGERLIEEHKSPSSYVDMLKTQPLDEESASQKQKLALKAYLIQRNLANAEERVDLIEYIYELNAGASGGADIPKSLENIQMGGFMSPRLKNKRELKKKKAKRALIDALRNGFTRSQELENETVKKLQEKMNGLSVSMNAYIDMKRRTQTKIDDTPHTPLPSSTKRRSFLPTSRSKGAFSAIKPRPLSFASPSPQAKKQSNSIIPGEEKKQDASIVTAAKMNKVSKAIREIARSSDSVPVESFKGLSVGFKRTDSPSKGRRWNRNVKSGLMFSPDGVSQRSGNAGVQGGLASTVTNLFSQPPPSSAHAVSEQEKLSSVSFALPTQRQSVSMSSVAEKALVLFGTTPAKTARNSDLIKKGLEAKSKPPAAPKVEIKKYESNKPAAFQFAPATAKNSEPEKEDAKKSAPAGISSTKSGEGLSSSFKGFGGFGQDNSSDKKAPLLFGEAVEDSKPAAQDTSKDKDARDYKKILTQFYQKHKPAKVAEVDKLLEKYKGKEKEMFAKLAQNYRTDNPLEVPVKETVGFGSTPSGGFGSFASATATAAAPAPATTQESEPDYRTFLVQFYHKHNAAKLSEVEQTLKKYKGKEKEMFAKLAQKYKTQNPLEPTATATTPALSAQSVSSTASTVMASNVTTASSTNIFAPAPAASAFGSTSASPFGQSTGFGAPAPAPASGGFGAFGAPAAAPTASPFGTAPPQQQPSPFGASPLAAPTPFGSAAAPSPSPFGAAPAQQKPKFLGKTPRELLTAFYQEKNPSKIHEVDKLLAKYAGREELLFRNLAKKYSLDPSMFGLSPQPQQQTQQQGFGMTSTLGGGSAFGQTSTLGQGTGFGGAPAASAPTPFGAAPASGGFGSFASGTAPTTSTPFGSAAPSGGGGFGAFGGGSPAPSFGQTSSPFGGPRR